MSVARRARLGGAGAHRASPAPPPLLIVAMLAVILMDVFRGGAARVTWEFLSQPRRERE